MMIWLVTALCVFVIFFVFTIRRKKKIYSEVYINSACMLHIVHRCIMILSISACKVTTMVIRIAIDNTDS